MKMLHGCPFEKIHFLTRIDTILDSEETEKHHGKSLIMTHSYEYQDHKEFQITCMWSKVPL